MNSQDNQRNFVWLKWILISLFGVIIIALIYSAFLYKDIENDKREHYSAAEKEILSETELNSIHQLTHFYSKSVYYIAFGTTKNNEEKVVFLKQDDKSNITVIDTDEIMSEEDVKSLWSSKCNNCELIKITPGMIDQEPLWELTYRDSKERYILDYVSIKNGEREEQFQFKQTFKN